MSETLYRVVEVVGSSSIGIEDAVKGAVAHAAAAGRDIAWFKIVDTRGHVVKGRVASYQVTVKIGFTLGATG